MLTFCLICTTALQKSLASTRWQSSHMLLLMVNSTTNTCWSTAPFITCTQLPVQMLMEKNLNSAMTWFFRFNKAENYLYCKISQYYLLLNCQFYFDPHWVRFSPYKSGIHQSNLCFAKNVEQFSLRSPEQSIKLYHLHRSLSSWPTLLIPLSFFRQIERSSLDSSWAATHVLGGCKYLQSFNNTVKIIQ